MKDLIKKALSLANKDGQKFIKTWILGKLTGFAKDDFKIIGIENVDYSCSWFLVIYEYTESYGHSKGKRKVSAAAISGYWSGGAKSTFYGDLRHVGEIHAENRMSKLFGNRFAHHDSAFYQCNKAKCIELNRKYNYEPRHEW